MNNLLQYLPVVLTVICYVAWQVRLEAKTAQNSKDMREGDKAIKLEQNRVERDFKEALDRIRQRTEEQIHEVKSHNEKQDSDIRDMQSLSKDIGEIKTHILYLKEGFDKMQTRTS